jgi:transposase-like protein
MNPQSQFCHNPQCPARGRRGQGHNRVPSQAEQRDRCRTCGQTFAATKGTPCYRLPTAVDRVTMVLTLLCHGCPIQAGVAALGLDDRIGAAWLAHAGQHRQPLHQHVVQQGYVPAFRRGFRHPVRTGPRGRPRLVREPGLRLGQVVKRYGHRRVVNGERRVVQRAEAAIAAVLATTSGGTAIYTAYLERLNATFRASWVSLVRRGRASAPTEVGLTAGMWLVGCTYNFCWLHDSLRLQAPAGACWRWQERSPALAAGLTNHRWTMRELLGYQVPLPAWAAPKGRGRPPKRALQPAVAVAA